MLKHYSIVSHHITTIYIILFILLSEKERLQKEVKQKTVSLWSYINSDQDLYKNPLYWPQQHALEPVASLRYIKMWKGLYCRWNPSMRPQVTNYLLITNDVL